MGVTLRLLSPDATGGWSESRAPLTVDAVETVLAAARGVRRAASYGAEWNHHSVYVALLQQVPREGKYSLYVGMSGLSPEERYMNQLGGRKAGRRWIQKYGVGLLPDVYQRCNPMSDQDARLVERRLALAFRRAGIPAHSA